MKPFPNSWLLRGRVVQPDGSALERTLHIDRGKIGAVAAERPAGTEGLPLVQAKADEYVFPGLLDLHTHSDYNILPIWETPFVPFDNRFGWRSDTSYKRLISQTKKDLYEAGGKADVAKRWKATLAVFGELQAVAGGTAVLQESYPLDEQIGAVDGPLLCRDTADPGDLGLADDKPVLSVVDFFRRDEKTGDPSIADGWVNQKPVGPMIEYYAKQRDAGKLSAVLLHLAEGRSGFGRGVDVDGYTRREFETFMAHPAMADVEAVKKVPLTIIHGSGIDPGNPDHVRFLTDRGISVLWSPVSNLLLYQDTLDVESFLRTGINFALGSDWSPSGSKHVWDEAKFARFCLDATGAQVSDAEIFQMATVNAARCLGTDHLGRIAESAAADFFVLRSDMSDASPLEVLLSGSDANVRATVIGGTPIYGVREVFEPLGLDTQPLPRVEGTAAANKLVHLPEGVDVDLQKDMQEIENFLKLRGILRSNTLATADVQYGARIARLRAYTAEYGWSAQRMRHELQFHKK